MKQEIKIVEGDASHVQKVLSEWMDEYTLQIGHMAICQGRGGTHIVVLLTRIKKGGE